MRRIALVVLCIVERCIVVDSARPEAIFIFRDSFRRERHVLEERSRDPPEIVAEEHDHYSALLCTILTVLCGWRCFLCGRESGILLLVVLVQELVAVLRIEGLLVACLGIVHRERMR